MSIREDLERALEPFYKLREMLTVPHGFHKQMDFDALAEQATIGEIEIVHIPASGGFGALTAIELGRQTVYLDGHHGTPGKAICIIVHDPKTGILPDRASIEDSRTNDASREEQDGDTG